MILTGTSLATSYCSNCFYLIVFYDIVTIPYLTLSMFLFFWFHLDLFFFCQGSQLSEVHMSKVVAPGAVGVISVVVFTFVNIREQRHHCVYSQLQLHRKQNIQIYSQTDDIYYIYCNGGSSCDQNDSCSDQTVK